MRVDITWLHRSTSDRVRQCTSFSNSSKPRTSLASQSMAAWKRSRARDACKRQLEGANMTEQQLESERERKQSPFRFRLPLILGCWNQRVSALQAMPISPGSTNAYFLQTHHYINHISPKNSDTHSVIHAINTTERNQV